MCGSLNDFTFLGTPEHFHVLFDIDFNIDYVLGVADEILDLFVLDIDFPVPCVPFTR